MRGNEGRLLELWNAVGRKQTNKAIWSQMCVIFKKKKGRMNLKSVLEAGVFRQGPRGHRPERQSHLVLCSMR